MADTADDFEARMRQLAARVERREERGACTGCGTAFPPPPAPAICPKCELAAALPAWRTWPPYLRAWLVFELMRRQMVSSGSRQASWERLLKAAFTATDVAPDGRRWPIATAAAELFPAALTLSREWVGTDSFKHFLTFIMAEAPTDGAQHGEPHGERERQDGHARPGAAADPR